MKREQQHTPTPWRLTDNEIVSDAAWLIEPNAANDEEGIPITVVNLTGAMGGEDGDAAFIVTAVNSHEKLIEALQSAIKWMDFVNEKLSDPDQLAANVKKYGGVKYVLQFGEGAGYRASEARAALASAEAGTTTTMIDDEGVELVRCAKCQRWIALGYLEAQGKCPECGDPNADEVIDCAKCGRHYEATPDDDLQDIKDRIALDGFCCDYCKEESDRYLAAREAGTVAAGAEYDPDCPTCLEQEQRQFQEQLRQTMLSNPLVKEVDLSDL